MITMRVQSMHAIPKQNSALIILLLLALVTYTSNMFSGSEGCIEYACCLACDPNSDLLCA